MPIGDGGEAGFIQKERLGSMLMLEVWGKGPLMRGAVLQPGKLDVTHTHTPRPPLTRLHAFFILTAWREEPLKLVITAMNRPQHAPHTVVPLTLTSTLTSTY